MEKYNRWEKCGKLTYNTAGYYLVDYAFGIKTWKTNRGGGIFLPTSRSLVPRI